MVKLGIFVVLTVLAYSEATRTINSHLSGSDLERLNKVFLDGIKSSDLQAVYYSALNLNQLTSEEKTSTCSRLLNLHAESKLNEFEKNYYLTGAHKQLGCTGNLPEATLSNVKSSLSKEPSTTHELFFNYFSNKNVGAAVDEATKSRLAGTLQTLLKADDSLSSVGHAFNIAADLGTQGSVISKWIEGTIAQADEVDGKLLQFEGGLSITALIVNGVLKLTTSTKSAPPLSEDQTNKFVAYFLSRRSVQQAKGASVLLEVLNTIAADAKLAPVCIQLIGNGQVQPESPVVSVEVVDILGNALKPAVSSVTATVTSKSDNSVLVSKTTLSAKSSDKTVYALDLSASKPTRGSYVVDITADSFKQTLIVKVLGKVSVSSLEIGVGETDSTSNFNKQTVSFPNKLNGALNADHQQKVLLKTLLVDASTGKPITVHQAFVLLINQETKEEIIFVAEQDSSKAYKFDLDVGARGADFGHRSGSYALELIVGDASLSNSFRWAVADLELKFNQEPAARTDKNNTRIPRAEIIHQFREPEKRPPRFVSDVFTALCAAPLLILFILWIKLGVNVSNFSFSLGSIGFHLGFGSILALFGLFWYKLNMFETLRLLAPLAVVTFLFGHRLLRSIASRKTEAK